jgi:putative PIN family toxin of toxin-antitoxin system
LRVVLDTNVLIRAHERGSSRARGVLNALHQPAHKLIVSNELLKEVVRVLRYPRFQNIYGLSEQALFDYKQYLETVGECVGLDIPYSAPLRDPSDLMVLQTADVGRADLLVTADPDFYDAAVLRYCEARHIDVCDERMALARLL